MRDYSILFFFKMFKGLFLYIESVPSLKKYQNVITLVQRFCTHLNHKMTLFVSSKVQNTAKLSIKCF